MWQYKASSGILASSKSIKIPHAANEMLALEPGAEYCFWLKCRHRGENVWSDWSEELKCTIPTLPPIELKCGDTTDQSAQLEWEIQDGSRGLHIEYELQVGSETRRLQGEQRDSIEVPDHEQCSAKVRYKDAARSEHWSDWSSSIQLGKDPSLEDPSTLEVRWSWDSRVRIFVDWSKWISVPELINDLVKHKVLGEYSESLVVLEFSDDKGRQDALCGRKAITTHLAKYMGPDQKHTSPEAVIQAAKEAIIKVCVMVAFGLLTDVGCAVPSPRA